MSFRCLCDLHNTVYFALFFLECYGILAYANDFIFSFFNLTLPLCLIYLCNVCNYHFGIQLCNLTFAVLSREPGKVRKFENLRKNRRAEKLTKKFGHLKFILKALDAI